MRVLNRQTDRRRYRKYYLSANVGGKKRDRFPKYHVTKIPQWRLVDVGHHTPVVTGVCCIDWVKEHGTLHSLRTALDEDVHIVSI